MRLAAPANRYDKNSACVAPLSCPCQRMNTFMRYVCMIYDLPRLILHVQDSRFDLFRLHLTPVPLAFLGQAARASERHTLRSSRDQWWDRLARGADALLAPLQRAFGGRRAQDFTDGDDPSVKAHWAVLVAGSNGWGNYRHQADVYHAYQVDF